MRTPRENKSAFLTKTPSRTSPTHAPLQVQHTYVARRLLLSPPLPKNHEHLHAGKYANLVHANFWTRSDNVRIPVHRSKRVWRYREANFITPNRWKATSKERQSEREAAKKKKTRVRRLRACYHPLSDLSRLWNIPLKGPSASFSSNERQLKDNWRLELRNWNVEIARQGGDEISLTRDTFPLVGPRCSSSVSATWRPRDEASKKRVSVRRLSFRGGGRGMRQTTRRQNKEKKKRTTSLTSELKSITKFG